MAKRKSGALDFVKAPPTRPRGIDPYSQPYSLGDIEYLAYLRDIAKGSKKTELAIDDIERETGGDFGKVIKEVTGEGQLPEKFLKGFSKEKFYGTTRRGSFYPEQKDKDIDRTILVNLTDYRDKFGEKYDKRDIDSRSFLEKLKGLLGYERKFDLEKERKEGEFPTKEEMEKLQQAQEAEGTTRHKLDHYFFNLMKRLGYELPGELSKGSYEEAFVTDTDYVLPKDKFGRGMETQYFKRKYYDKYNEILEGMADKELKKRRGYNMGGLVAMLKGFK